MISTASAPAAAGTNSAAVFGKKKKTTPNGVRHQSPPPNSGALERVSSVDSAPVPLRRASYAFDQRFARQQRVASTPPCHNTNGMTHQHSAPVQSQHDSSDCGSSSGLGGMGTPIKDDGGCSASCSTSSNNSVAADSHDSRDSGGPVSSRSGANDANSVNGHRSLVATATLTPSMVSSQQTTTSPVSIVPAVSASSPLAHALPASQTAQALPPPPPHIFSPQQFGAFPALPHHHHHQQGHAPHMNAHLPPALLHQHAAQLNALHAVAAAAAAAAASGTPLMAAPPPPTGPLHPTSAAPPLYGAYNNSPPKQQQWPPPAAMAAASGASPPAQKAATSLQHLPPPSNRALYTMTCETAALASVGAAAVTAGYHVTLEPCASAPPIISAALAPPPGFHAAAVPTNGGGDSQQPNVQLHQDQNGGGSPSSGMLNGPIRNGDLSNGPMATGAGTGALALPPGVPPEIAAAINGGHDLFVHIHPGDAIALAVGNDIQHIHGPATIRMVSQAMPPSAIPMSVPQGHVVQQLLDRQGYLSHIIMSQEVPPPSQSGPLGAQPTTAGIPAVQNVAASTSVPPVANQQQSNLLHPPLQQQRQGTPQKHGNSANRLTNNHSPHSSSGSPPNTQQPHQFVVSQNYQQPQQQQMASLEQQQQQPPHYIPQEQVNGPSQTGGGGPMHKWRHQQNHYGGAVRARGSSESGFHADMQQQQQHFQQQSATAAGPFYVQGPNGMAMPGQESVPNYEHASAYGAHQQVGPFDQATTAMIEEDEKERLKDALSSLQPPIPTRVGERDVHVIWQELDTSEAAASGGPFPQIDPSEFLYKLILYDVQQQSQTCYDTETGTNMLHLQRLRPGTEYMISIQAELPERGIIGHPSGYASFCTHCARPDSPPMPKLMSRQQGGISVQWRPSNCNGAQIIAYCLQMSKGKATPFDTVYEGPHEQSLIQGLDPAMLYRFRVFARNEIGLSESSPVLYVYPERDRDRYHHYHHGQQQQHYGAQQQFGSMASSPSSSSIPPQQSHQQQIRPPQSPNIYSVAPRAIKLSWNNQPCAAYYSSVVLEMCDLQARGSPHFAPIASECYAHSGTFANVTGLYSGREYRFRLAAMTHTGEQLHSDHVTVRTRYEGGYREHRNKDYEGQHYSQQHDRSQLRPSTYDEEEQQQQQRTSPASAQQQRHSSVPMQQKKAFASAAANPPAAAATAQPAAKKKDSTQKAPQKSVEGEEQQAVGGQQQPPEKPQPKAPNCSTPKFSAISSESTKVSWRILGTPGSPRKGNSLDSVAPSTSSAPTNASSGSNAALVFELQRVDKQQPMMIFSGNETEFEYKGLKPVEHLQLRVRAVLLDTEGKRLEGEWSPVGSACTLCAPPSAPRNVRLAEPGSPAVAGASDEDEKREKKAASAHSVWICWDAPAQPNGASISEYTVHSQRFCSGTTSFEKPLEECLLGSTAIETRLHIQRLLPAQLYRFTVTAHNEAGSSQRSEPLEYQSAPGVPDAPRDVHAEPLSTTELQLSWMEPHSCNGAQISSYHVNCYKLNTRVESGAQNSSRQRQLVSQQIVPGSQRLLLVQSLEAETDYELCIQAENAVGKSVRETTRCATLAEPPQPPQLALAQSTANVLKLRWTEEGENATSAIRYYYLERENENGTYSPVYEGELRTAKVKGLRERSTHHFRIRAAVSKGQMLGPWSRRYAFQTTRQPPPAPKQAPSVCEVSNGSEQFQFEWNALRHREADEEGEEHQGEQRFVYRLQIALKVALSAKEKAQLEVWKTEYEGPATECTLLVSNAGQQPRQARLFVVQQFLNADGKIIEECVSAPSPVVVFSSQKTPNDSPKKRPLGKNTPGSSHHHRGRKQESPVRYPPLNNGANKMSVGKRLRRLGSWLRKTVSEKDCALIVLAIFVLLAFGIAILLNNFYLN